MKAKNPRRTASRRSFLKSTAATLLGAAGSDDSGAEAKDALTPARPASAFAQRPGQLQPVDAHLPVNLTRTWLGPHFWANRLQDWRLNAGRIECVANRAADRVRMVAVLTREVVRGNAAAYISLRMGVLELAAGGFGGLLIGAGAGELNYRAAALVQKASGTGGGLLCVCDTKGRLSFREHTNEDAPLLFAEIKADETMTGANPLPLAANSIVRLRLDITPQSGHRFELRFTVADDRTGTPLGGIVRGGVAEADILGGIALVSSPFIAAPITSNAPGAEGNPAPLGARFWFDDLRTGGAKIAVRPERALGPILGALYSINSSTPGNDATLKLSAQLLPIGDAEPQQVRLQYRAPGSARWRDGGAERIGAGYTALFRIANWDARRDWEYRVLYQAGDGKGARGAATNGATFTGTIRRDSGQSKPLVIAAFSCVLNAARSFEGGANPPLLPGEKFTGRYTGENLYFPHTTLVRNASHHKADLLVFSGDQIYEGNPTAPDRRPQFDQLDYLYKWYLWLWAFRDLTRATPTIVQVDDHDVFQGNIWGMGGKRATEETGREGGYGRSPAWVNLAQRTQCGHNPDSYDSTPIEQGISVYYGQFRYGGVSFAILEDRKFKSAPALLRNPAQSTTDLQLLGERQEQFLAAWGRDRRPGEPKICLTQTVFACVQTNVMGQPMRDVDSNGTPKPARDRAIRLLRDARALVIAGDQHLSSLVRHGLDEHTDGVLQFATPGGGTLWQRWFEPAATLPNPAGMPQTGDFVDGFGNRLRVLAVANPKVTQRQFRQTRGSAGGGNSNNLGDRRLKSEGYGIVRVDHRRQTYVIECWPWDADPTRPEARQFPGWPYQVSFTEVGRLKM